MILQTNNITEGEGWKSTESYGKRFPLKKRRICYETFLSEIPHIESHVGESKPENLTIKTNDGGKVTLCTYENMSLQLTPEEFNHSEAAVSQKPIKLNAVPWSRSHTKFYQGIVHKEFLKSSATLLLAAEIALPYEQPRTYSAPTKSVYSTPFRLNETILLAQGKSEEKSEPPYECRLEFNSREAFTLDTTKPTLRRQGPTCSKSYSTMTGRSKHVQYHRGTSEKKYFVCEECEKAYSTLGALKMHVKTHTLPCKCNQCGKAFSRPWLLQGHLRTHTGEKPFVCVYCNRAFADRSNLRAHLQTHSQLKKYCCAYCSKSFSRMSLLTKHSESGCSFLLK